MSYLSANLFGLHHDMSLGHSFRDSLTVSGRPITFHGRVIWPTDVLEVIWAACASKHVDVAASEAVLGDLLGNVRMAHSSGKLLFWILASHPHPPHARPRTFRSYFLCGHLLLVSGPHTPPQLYTSLLCRGVAGTFDMEMLEGP